MTAAIYLCTGLAHGLSRKKTIGTKDKSYEWWTDVVKVAFTFDQWYRIKEFRIKN